MVIHAKLVETDVFPKASQIPPFQYEKALQSEMQEKDEAVILTIASKLFGCCHSALLGTREMKHVYVVDSETCSMGEQLLVRKVCMYREAGLDAETIVSRLEAWMQRPLFPGWRQTENRSGSLPC